jgi:hypothetical protein
MYKNTEKMKFYRMGQERGKSPFILTLLSRKSMKIYKKYAKGAEYQDTKKYIQQN